MSILAATLEEQLQRRLTRVAAEAHRLLGSDPEEPSDLRRLIADLSRRTGQPEDAEHHAALTRLTQRFEARFEAIRRVQAAVTRLRAVTSPDAMLAQAPAALCQGSRFERAIFSVVAEGRMVARTVHFGADPDNARSVLAELQASPVALEHPLIETELVRRRRATIVVEADVHPRVDRRTAELMGWRSYVAAPLSIGKRLVGVIHADRGPDQPLEVLDRDVLWAFATGLSQAYESASLRRALRQEREQMRHFLEWIGARSGELTEARITLADARRAPVPPPWVPEDGMPPQGRDDRVVFAGGRRAGAVRRHGQVPRERHPAQAARGQPGRGGVPLSGPARHAPALSMVSDMRTQVGIVGAGPAGLTLSLLLQRAGIDSVVLESRPREYVEKRVRAGLLEHNTVELLHQLEVGERLAREGLEHHGIYLRHRGQTQHIPMTELTGRRITIYGQQEVVKDLIAARVERGGTLLFEVSNVAVSDLEGERPRIGYTHDGRHYEVECDVIAGCDGFHGVCRASIPDQAVTEHEFVYPFSWLGILADAEPSTDELIYSWHERGFSLYTMRSSRISRLYLQVPNDDSLENWPDERIWEELQVRHASEGWRVNEGPIFEKGITPMRSFVAEPMRYGRLFLAGDAAHIVPPTGAKGLNLAVNDVRLLAAALVRWYETGSSELLETYSDTALRRVWRAQDFSNYMTQLLHQLGGGPFESQLQLARLAYLARSEAAACSLAENYAGLPAAPDF
jgi:p-hydroxybenzoate 3-monooxygenase